MRNESTGLQPAIAEQARALVEEAGSLDEALRGLARLGDSLGVWRSSLRILQDDELVIAGVWSRVSTALTVGTKIPIRSSDFLDVLRHDGPLVRECPDEHPSLLDQILIDEGSRSWVLIPLREERVPVGVLALTSRIPRAFCREDAPVYAAVGKAIEQSLLDLARRSGRLRR